MTQPKLRFFTVVELGALAWACGRLQLPLGPQFWTAVAASAQRLFPQAKSRHFAMIAAGLAGGGHCPGEPWLERFEEASEDILPTFADHELACVALAFTQMGHQPGPRWLAAFSAAAGAAAVTAPPAVQRGKSRGPPAASAGAGGWVDWGMPSLTSDGDFSSSGGRLAAASGSRAASSGVPPPAPGLPKLRVAVGAMLTLLEQGVVYGAPVALDSTCWDALLGAPAEADALAGSGEEERGGFPASPTSFGGFGAGGEGGSGRSGRNGTAASAAAAPPQQRKSRFAGGGSSGPSGSIIRRMSSGRRQQQPRATGKPQAWGATAASS